MKYDMSPTAFQTQAIKMIDEKNKKMTGSERQYHNLYALARRLESGSVLLGDFFPGGRDGMFAGTRFPFVELLSILDLSDEASTITYRFVKAIFQDNTIYNTLDFPSLIRIAQVAEMLAKNNNDININEILKYDGRNAVNFSKPEDEAMINQFVTQKVQEMNKAAQSDVNPRQSGH